MLNKIVVQFPERQENTTELVNLTIFREKVVARAIVSNSFSLNQRYRGKNLSNFNYSPGKILSIVQAVKSKRSVFLSGSCGSGKTHMACGLMYEYYKNGIIDIDGSIVMPEKPFFKSISDFILDLKDSFDKTGETEKD